MHKYEIIISWNEADEAFIAEMPALKGCIAHGETQEDALRQVKSVAQEWLKIAADMGWSIPESAGKLMIA